MKNECFLFVKTWILFTQGCFVPSLAEIDPVVLEMISKFRQCIFTISLLSPLGKGYDPSFEHSWIPFTQGCFVLSLVEISPVFWKRIWKCEKFTDRRTTGDQTESSGELINNIIGQLAWHCTALSIYVKIKKSVFVTYTMHHSVMQNATCFVNLRVDLLIYTYNIINYVFIQLPSKYILMLTFNSTLQLIMSICNLNLIVTCLGPMIGISLSKND